MKNILAIRDLIAKIVDLRARCSIKQPGKPATARAGKPDNVYFSGKLEEVFIKMILELVGLTGELPEGVKPSIDHLRNATNKVEAQRPTFAEISKALGHCIKLLAEKQYEYIVGEYERRGMAKPPAGDNAPLVLKLVKLEEREADARADIAALPFTDRDRPFLGKSPSLKEIEKAEEAIKAKRAEGSQQTPSSFADAKGADKLAALRLPAGPAPAPVVVTAPVVETPVEEPLEVATPTADDLLKQAVEAKRAEVAAMEKGLAKAKAELTAMEKAAGIEPVAKKKAAKKPAKKAAAKKVKAAGTANGTSTAPAQA